MNSENYKVLVNLDTYNFHIQMDGKEVDSVGYEIAADAIDVAEGGR